MKTGQMILGEMFLSLMSLDFCCNMLIFVGSEFDFNSMTPQTQPAWGQ